MEEKMDTKKIKKIVKYVVNILNLINFIILGLTPIWNIPYGKEISDTIIVIVAGLSTYLLGSKAKEKLTMKGE